MNKAELIGVMAELSDLSKVSASSALDAFISTISDGLSKGESVTLVGFGTFGVRERAGRTGRNPQTGASIEIPASTVPYFKPGKALKEAVK